MLGVVIAIFPKQTSSFFRAVCQFHPQAGQFFRNNWTLCAKIYEIAFATLQYVVGWKWDSNCSCTLDGYRCMVEITCVAILLDCHQQLEWEQGVVLCMHIHRDGVLRLRGRYLFPWTDCIIIGDFLHSGMIDKRLSH